MQETWLRTNRRILLLGMILPAVLVLGGLIVAGLAQSGDSSWLSYVGFTVSALGVALFAILLPQLIRPRLAYVNGQLRVYLRAGNRCLCLWKLWNVFSWAPASASCREPQAKIFR